MLGEEELPWDTTGVVVELEVRHDLNTVVGADWLSKEVTEGGKMAATEVDDTVEDTGGFGWGKKIPFWRGISRIGIFALPTILPTPGNFWFASKGPEEAVLQKICWVNQLQLPDLFGTLLP